MGSIRIIRGVFDTKLELKDASVVAGFPSPADKDAGIGVAMGNALESLKAEAEYTTTSIDDDGVLNALRHST